MNYSITVLPGDGIGPEVVAEAVKVMNAVGNRFGHTFDTGYGRVGGNAIDDFGTPLPEETVEMCAETDGILFGAVGGPKWDDPRAPTRPEDGILAIRKSLGLFANLRPVKVYPQLINSSPIKPHPARRRGHDYRARVDGRTVFRQAQEALGQLRGDGAAWTR